MATIEEERKKQPSVLRTFRLSSSLDAALSKDAEKRKIGKNSLVVSILDKYVEWDSLAADFGYLTVPPEMIAMFVSSLDKQAITSIARELSKKVLSSLPLWYGRADLDSLLKYIETSVKYSGARLPQRIEREGNVIRIITYQPFNENGAIWIREFNMSLIESVLGYPPRIVKHENSIETIIELKDIT